MGSPKAGLSWGRWSLDLGCRPWSGLWSLAAARQLHRARGHSVGRLGPHRRVDSGERGGRLVRVRGLRARRRSAGAARRRLCWHHGHLPGGSVAFPRLVVDLGCGPGFSTALLRDVLAPDRVVAVDSSQTFVREAAERLGASAGGGLTLQVPSIWVRMKDPPRRSQRTGDRRLPSRAH